MSLRLPKCDFCKYCSYDEANNKLYCKAFPDGIPLVEIPDDEEAECANGIKFERDTSN